MTPTSRPIYTHTGHPLVDVGAAVIAAFNDRDSVEEVTEEDLERVREFLKREFVAYKGDASSNAHECHEKPMTSYLSVALHKNSVFINSTTEDSRRKRDITELIAPSDEGPGEPVGQCAFCWRPAKRRYHRHEIPMVTGQDIVNWGPGGSDGLPACPYCVLAVQAYPLGTLKCGGKALLVHSPESPTLTRYFAEEYLKTHHSILSTGPTADGKYPDAKQARTAVFAKMQEGLRYAVGNSSLTAYHFSNSGQGPSIEIHHLPSELLAFVTQARALEGWQYAVQRGWRLGLGYVKGKPAEAPERYEVGEHRNQLYEDLFRLANDQLEAGRFVRKHLCWRTPDSLARAPTETAAPDAWPLTELFLRMVLLMDKPRVDVLRTLGERLAGYVVDHNEKRLFDRLWLKSGKYYLLRTHLLRASHAQVQRGEAPLISFEEFLLAFEEGEETARVDWALARDLMLIKMMDELHARGWLKEHAAELEDLPEDETEAAD